MAYYGQPMMGGGMPTATISGPDMNHDGIPDQLQGGMPMMGGMPMQQPMMGMPMQQPMMQPMMGGYQQPPLYGRGPGLIGLNNRPTDYNHNGIPDRQEGGVVGLMGKFLKDNNGNGVPDFLEGKHRRY